MIGTESRNKHIFEESTPGPGKYQPSIKYARYHNGGAGYMGIKIKSNMTRVPVGTEGTKVGPTSYEIGEQSDKYKFAFSPKFSFGNGIRKTLGKKIETKNETYAIVSACGEQVNSPKDSRPQFTFSKAKRF